MRPSEDGSVSLKHDHGKVRITPNGKLVEITWKCKVPHCKEVVTHIPQYVKDENHRLVPKVTIENKMVEINNIFPKELLPEEWFVPVCFAASHSPAETSHLPEEEHSITSSSTYQLDSLDVHVNGF